MFQNNLLMAATSLSAGGVILTYITAVGDAVNRTVYTFSSVSFGDASSGRVIVVNAGAGTSSARTISSVTIGGVTATQAAQAAMSESCNGTFYAVVSTGTSGDIVVTYSGSCNRSGIGVWGLAGAAATAHDTVSDSASNPIALPLSIPASGAAIGGCYTNGATHSWANLTENFEQNPEASHLHSGASATFEEEQTDLAIAVTLSSASMETGSAVSFGPI